MYIDKNIQTYTKQDKLASGIQYGLGRLFPYWQCNKCFPSWITSWNHSLLNIPGPGTWTSWGISMIQ